MSPMDAGQGHNSVEIAPGVALPDAAVTFTFSRSGGPGGQHANKTSTRATLTVPLAALGEVLPAWAMRRLVERAGPRLAGDRIMISAADSRSQIANRRACLLRLRQMVVEALNRPRRRRRTRPSAGAVQRRLDAKKQRGQRKHERRSGRDRRVQ